jgi:hypothetical protein
MAAGVPPRDVGLICEGSVLEVLALLMPSRRATTWAKRKCQGWRSHMFGHAATTGFISLAVVGVYLIGLLASYGFADDYLLLAGNHGLAPDPFDLYVSGGRPLGGVLSMTAFSLADGINQLRWIRFAGVIGIVMLALLMHRTLLLQGLSNRGSALIAVFVCVLPPFQVYASWATLFVVPYAAFLAGIASLIAISAIGSDRRSKVIRFSVAAGALGTAALVHQSAAMFFWVFAAIPILFAEVRLRRLIQISAYHLGTGAIAGVVAYIAFRIGIGISGGLSPERSSLTDDMAAKGEWFIRYPVVQALNISNIFPSTTLAVVVSGTIILGLAIEHRQQPGGLLVVLGLVALLAVASHAPSLLIAESWASYRSQGALSALIGLCLAAAVMSVARFARHLLARSDLERGHRAGATLGFGVGVAAVTAAALVAEHNVAAYFVEPQTKELRLMRADLEHVTIPPIERILIIPVGWWQGMTTIRYDEFGFPTSAFPHALEPATRVILAEREEQAGSIPIHVLMPDACCAKPTARVPRGLTRRDVVVDVRSLTEFRTSRDG